jgi:hypothetical protein
MAQRKGCAMVSLKIADELLDLGAQYLLAGKIATAKKLSRQYGERNLDLIEPLDVLGREVEGDAMLGIAQEGLAGHLGSEPLTPSLPLRPQHRATRRTTDSERWMLRLSQTMSHLVLAPALLGKRRRKRAKFFLVRRLPTTPSTSPVATSKAASLRAVAAVFELTPLDLAGHHRQSRCDALQGLNAGHLVDGDGAMGIFSGSGGFINRAGCRTLAVKGWIRLRGQPVPDAMQLEVGLYFKNRPTEHCEICGTRPRRMASSAISRWLQWR